VRFVTTAPLWEREDDALYDPDLDDSAPYSEEM
jgi:hypothetical protein